MKKSLRKKPVRKTPARKPAAKAKPKPKVNAKAKPAQPILKKVTKQAVKAPAPSVDVLLKASKHPFEAEVNAVRAIIKGVHGGITEEWKWAAPSLSYKGYLATFNLWQKGWVQLIVHNGAVLDQSLGIFEGTYPDRRIVNFATMADIRAKRAALVKAVQQWVKLRDRST